MSTTNLYSVIANPQLYILVDKSYQTLNMSKDEWISSDSRVLLRCGECNEEFWRDKRAETIQPNKSTPHLCKIKTTSGKNLFEVDVVRSEFKIVHEDGKMPFRKRSTDAGYDVHCIKKYTLEPNSTTSIETGLILTVPPGFFYTIEGRSSLWKMGIFPNTGIIDATYTGQLLISMVNMSPNQYTFEKGDRVAQIIVQKQYHIDFVEVKEFSREYSLRGENGFGSSGK